MDFWPTTAANRDQQARTMASRAQFTCIYCGRRNFKSAKGLQQHQSASVRCFHSAQAAMTNEPRPAYQPRSALGNVANLPQQQGTQNLHSIVGNVAGMPEPAPVAPNQGQGPDRALGAAIDPMQVPQVIIADGSGNPGQLPEIMGPDDNAEFPAQDDSSSATDSVATASLQQYTVPDDCEVSTEALAGFLAHRAHMQQQYFPFSKHEVGAIKLVDLLRRKRATMDTYEAVLEWHLRETGKIQPQMGLGDYPHYISRTKLLKKLAKRYLNTEQLFYVKTTKLPVSGTKVDLIYHEARDLVVSMLTDPRFSDEDFQHFDNDPLAPPPKLSYVGDTITGEAYRKTYQKLITDPKKQMLVPIQMYIDGAISGQFGKLPVEALKMTLGLFNAKARGKRYAWRTLGYVPNYHKSTTRGARQYVETGHVAATSQPMSDDESAEKPLATEDESEASDDDSQSQQFQNVWNPDDIEYDEDAHENQDWHHILAHLLMTYRQMEQDGMLWNYKYRGKVYQNIELVFFLHFVKCDGDEADKLCGKYTTRTGNVKNLCRFCECPTGKSSWVFGDKFPRKTEAKIKKLVDRNDLEALRKMSQRNLKNAFYDLCFGLHNKMGIHGACPMEMLHHILLGIFKYVTVGFKEHIGLSSQHLDDINALAKQYGYLFARNSDRDLPKTTFSKGILHGKIMGKEYSGVMLIMAAILQSNLGRTILKNLKHFKKNSWLKDWSVLVETLLQWEAYLKLPEMELKHVNKLQDKHRVIMWLIKSVLRRIKGMGMDTIKFHGILHLVESIKSDGVPNVVDTGDNESHHKPTKYYSKLTQKNEKTFERQTATREDEFHLIDLALLEMEGKCIWEYLDTDQLRGGPENEPLDGKNVAVGSEEAETWTGGTQISVHQTDEGGISWCFTANPTKGGTWDIQVIKYLYELQEMVQEHVGELNIRCEHKRDGLIFRGHPNFKGTGLWNDWVLLNWDKHGDLPAEIWCFVDLSMLPEGVSVQVHDFKAPRGVYAVVESSEYVVIPTEDEDDPVEEAPKKRQKKKKSGPIPEDLGEPSTFGSELLRPFRKEVKEFKDGVFVRRFYLVDVDTFLDPICVVPDIGEKDKLRYFHVKARKEWANIFIEWLEQDEKIGRKTREMMEEEEGIDEYLLEVDRTARGKAKGKRKADDSKPKKKKKKKRQKR